MALEISLKIGRSSTKGSPLITLFPVQLPSFRVVDLGPAERSLTPGRPGPRRREQCPAYSSSEQAPHPPERSADSSSGISWSGQAGAAMPHILGPARPAPAGDQRVPDAMCSHPGQRNPRTSTGITAHLLCGGEGRPRVLRVRRPLPNVTRSLRANCVKPGCLVAAEGVPSPRTENAPRVSVASLRTRAASSRGPGPERRSALVHVTIRPVTLPDCPSRGRKSRVRTPSGNDIPFWGFKNPENPGIISSPFDRTDTVIIAPPARGHPAPCIRTNPKPAALVHPPPASLRPGQVKPPVPRDRMVDLRASGTPSRRRPSHAVAEPLGYVVARCSRSLPGGPQRPTRLPTPERQRLRNARPRSCSTVRARPPSPRSSLAGPGGRKNGSSSPCSGQGSATFVPASGQLLPEFRGLACEVPCRADRRTPRRGCPAAPRVSCSGGT